MLAIAGCGAGAGPSELDGTIQLDAADGGPGEDGGDATDGQPGRDGTPGASEAGEAPADPPPGTPRKIRDALAVWRDFPVGTERRPVVMSGASAYERAAITPGDGPEFRESYLMNPAISFTDPEHLPAGPTEASGYRLTTPAAALATLHGIADQWHRHRYKGTIRTVRATTANFWTDRGMQPLPAWAVKYGPRHSSGSSGTAYVMAVAPPDRYGPDQPVLEDVTPTTTTFWPSALTE
jgi:hypothetical protein